MLLFYSKHVQSSFLLLHSDSCNYGATLYCIALKLTSMDLSFVFFIVQRSSQSCLAIISFMCIPNAKVITNSEVFNAALLHHAIAVVFCNSLFLPCNKYFSFAELIEPCDICLMKLFYRPFHKIKVLYNNRIASECTFVHSFLRKRTLGFLLHLYCFLHVYRV